MTWLKKELTVRSSALWATLVALSSKNLPSLTWNWETFSVRGMTKSSNLIEPLVPATCQHSSLPEPHLHKVQEQQ